LGLSGSVSSEGLGLPNGRKRTGKAKVKERSGRGRNVSFEGMEQTKLVLEQVRLRPLFIQVTVRVGIQFVAIWHCFAQLQTRYGNLAPWRLWRWRWVVSGRQRIAGGEVGVVRVQREGAAVVDGELEWP